MRTPFAVFCIAAAALTTANLARAEDARGHWSGSIANALQVNVQFAKAADGPWEATLSVPSQGLVTKVEQLVVTPGELSFTLPRFKATYAATWNSGQQGWAGTWTQGEAVPLILRRSSAKIAQPERPQLDAIAARPAAYASSEVSFSKDAGGVTLAGTLTVPNGKGPFPAVVLVHGSGPINRDGDVFGHKVLLVLADHLSRNGIAVLRYDKRGVGKSSGNYASATTLDLAADAESALMFLRARTDVDAGRIGMVGHSEGGLIAPLVAARNPALAFVVMMAGPGIPGDRLLLEQLTLAAQAGGASADAMAKGRALNQAMLAALASEPTLEGARSKASLVLDDAERRGELPAGRAQMLIKGLATPWMHYYLRHDPAPALHALRQPVLVLNGELDMQVPSAMNLSAIRNALRNNPRAVVKELPQLNHLFQTAKTGTSAEYANIEETLAPLALETVSDWIKATIR